MNSKEIKYTERLQAAYSEHEVSPEILALAEMAVAEFPKSTKLWCLRGDLIQLGSSESIYELNDSLESYKKAIEVDPSNYEAHQEIAYFCDVHLEDYLSAEKSFRNAIKLGAGKESYLGLARVLAELNKSEDALKLLEPEKCPYHDEPEIKEIGEEISSGVWSEN